MIDMLKKIADAVQFLRLPSVVLGLICFIVISTILVGSEPHEEEFLAIPSAVGLLWAIFTYSFLVYFRAVPEKAHRSWKFVKRLKRRMVRTGYWIMGVVFVAITIGAIFVSYRMIAIWFRDYG